LITDSEQDNFWTLHAGTSPEKKVSLHLHQQLGFGILGDRDVKESEK
jgi:L-amino acid N-acyltransferase YncA